MEWSPSVPITCALALARRLLGRVSGSQLADDTVREPFGREALLPSPLEEVVRPQRTASVQTEACEAVTLPPAVGTVLPSVPAPCGSVTSLCPSPLAPQLKRG